MSTLAGLSLDFTAVPIKATWPPLAAGVTNGASRGHIPNKPRGQEDKHFIARLNAVYGTEAARKTLERYGSL
jgi:hypothetical protein